MRSKIKPLSNQPGNKNFKFLTALVIYVVPTLLYMGTFAAYLVLWALWGYLNKCVLNAMIVYVNVCITAFLLLLSLCHPRSKSQFVYINATISMRFNSHL